MGIRIILSDVREGLAGLPDESVHCCVTSPPYYGLRAYAEVEPQVWGGEDGCVHEWGDERQKIVAVSDKRMPEHASERDALMDGTPASQGAFCLRCGAWRGHLGLEPDLEMYIGHLVEIFREVRRALRRDGTLWLNIGDSYAGSWGAQSRRETPATLSRNQINNHPKNASHTGTIRDNGLKPKDLMMVPARLALALQADGWWLRSEIVWAKRAPMPESVTDRPTSAHEKVFLLTKSARYFYDAEAVKEPLLASTKERGYTAAYLDGEETGKSLAAPAAVRAKANWRANPYVPNGRNMRNVWHLGPEPYAEAHFATFVSEIPRRAIKAGCPRGGTVLDPFLGSGTTALVAAELGRDCIGIELSPEYAAMARNRLKAALVDVNHGGVLPDAPAGPLFEAAR